MADYSLKKGLIKGAKYIILFGVPFLLTHYPDVANITIGGVLAVGVNYLKTKYNLKI